MLNANNASLKLTKNGGMKIKNTENSIVQSIGKTQKIEKEEMMARENGGMKIENM